MKPLEFIEEVKTQNLGPTVFIIGGGPSLLKTIPDKNILNGKTIINTNNAYTLFPNALATQFADRIWWSWHRDKLQAQFSGTVTTSMAGSSANFQDMENAGVVVFGHGDRKGGISTEKHKLNSNNAGNQAINLAVHCGFQNIILLGFDMNPTDSKTQWHSDHKRITDKNQYEGTMIPGMKMVVPMQETLNFKVYNANPESNLKCFQFTNLNEWV